jgi:uncharacterized protein with FMN-binding domain
MTEAKNSGKGGFFNILLLILVVVIIVIIAFQIYSDSRERFAYEDGTYRGIYADTDEIQVSLQFTLENGIVTEARFRHLRRDDNYYMGNEEEPYRSVCQQYQEALQYLVGKNLQESLPDLYHPERIVRTEVDGYTSATIRSSKIISAVRDALSRGVYSY